MKKIERLLAIMLILKNEGKKTAAALATLLEVNIRTIYRDIDGLSQMGVPLSALSGKDGGYNIDPDYFLPSISFSRDEALALSIAYDLVKTVEIPGFEAFIHSAFLKIQNVISETESQKIEEVVQRILFDFRYIDPEMEGRSYFPLIRKSFETHQCLRIQYLDCKSGEYRQRLVEPYFLTYTDGVWYLRGKSGDKSFLWWFRLDRIAAIELVQEPFFLPKNFHREHYTVFQNHEAESGIRAEYIISNYLYRIIQSDSAFKESQWQSEGENFRVQTRPLSRDFHYDFMLRNLDEVTLLGPEHLRKDFLKQLEKARKKLTIL